jgi:hypothetical protein
MRHPAHSENSLAALDALAPEPRINSYVDLKPRANESKTDRQLARFGPIIRQRAAALRAPRVLSVFDIHAFFNWRSVVAFFVCWFYHKNYRCINSTIKIAVSINRDISAINSSRPMPFFWIVVGSFMLGEYTNSV